MDHKLTPDVASKILDALRQGLGRAAAAKSVGVGTRSMRRWMLLGRDDPGHLGAFRRAVLEAEGRAGPQKAKPQRIAPEVVSELVKVLRLGNYRVAAATYAEVAPRTLKRWIQLGKTRPGSEYEALRLAVLKAEQDAEIGCVAQVILAAKDDARHAEWWLTHRCGERWNPGSADGEPPRRDSSNPAGGLSLEELSDPELRIRLDAVEDRRAELEAQRTSRIELADPGNVR